MLHLCLCMCVSVYVICQDDILYSRARTSGILTDRYSISGHMFEIYDVGGQRNERRKWIHCFEGVLSYTVSSKLLFYHLIFCILPYLFFI